MPSGPALERLYALADGYYNKRNELENTITVLRCEQAEAMRMYDQVLARARDMELEDEGIL